MEYKNNAGQNLNSNRPEGRITIMPKEPPKYNIDIAALGVVRFVESGSIREEMGYTFFWIGKTSTDENESGFLPSISGDPKSVSDRLITRRFPFVDSRY